MKKFNKVISIAILIIIVTTNIAFADVDINENIKGALLGDIETGEILYQYNISEKVEIASVTKLMTYLVMREAVENGDVSFDDEVTISRHAANTPGSSFGLIQGETLKLSELVEPLLIVSGNDVATAIAEHVAGTEEDFVNLMYEKAEEIEITSARFINPHGMPIDDAETDQNFMAIEDLFKLARYILINYPDVVETTSKKELVISDRNYSKKSTNYQLLNEMEEVDGLKTGYTDKARCSLISTMPIIDNEDENNNFRLVSIIMGAYTHDEKVEKSKALLEYGRDNYIKERVVDKSVLLDTIKINNAKIIDVDIYPSEDFYNFKNIDDNIRTEVFYETSIKAPLAKGDIIGGINIYEENEKLGQVDIVVNRDVEKANIFVRLFRFIKGLFGK